MSRRINAAARHFLLTGKTATPTGYGPAWAWSRTSGVREFWTKELRDLWVSAAPMHRHALGRRSRRVRAFRNMGGGAT